MNKGWINLSILQMESKRITFEEKMRVKDEVIDLLQHEVQKLKKKIGMKGDADIIDLDSSEDSTLSEKEDI